MVHQPIATPQQHPLPCLAAAAGLLVGSPGASALSRTAAAARGDADFGELPWDPEAIIEHREGQHEVPTALGLLKQQWERMKSWEHNDSSQRQREIKVIGAGHGRTGTFSMMCALGMLGFKAAHGEIIINEDPTAWLDWAKGGSFQPALELLLRRGYNATTADQPAGFAYKELLAHFPRAKVILGVHPYGADGWVRAVSKRNWFGCFTGARELVSHFGDCCNFSKTLTETDRLDVCKREYLRDNEEVRNKVPSAQLLEFSPTDGWEPLCRFLGSPVPTEAFPKARDRRCAKFT